jgi:DNA (cytosine-5)-methyltransferase 1
MNFLDLFAGIGGFRLGMESAGHKCIGFCEIDKFARASYKAIHNTEGEIELHDITTVTNDEVRAIGHVDVICGGFPCQAFSIAGARRGFEDARGTLFFEIARFASILKPKYLFLENVKGLLNHDKGDTFEVILSALDELGYDVEWQVFNSKDFGVPQNRERVFIIGHLRGRGGQKVFPLSGDGATITCEQPKINKVGNIRKKGKSQSGDVVSIDSLAPTLCSTTTQKDPLKVLIKNENNHLSDGFRIRKLTPREFWRLQGFPDWAFDKAQKVNSNSQLYKQAGNSVTVNVVETIAREF